VLGAYLVTLWTADPNQIFRQFRARPACLPLPDLLDNLIQNPSITNLILFTHATAPPPSLSNTDSVSQTNMQLSSEDHALPTTPGSTQPPLPFKKVARYISSEICHLVAIRWYHIVFPVLLGEDIVAPPYILGKNKALTSTEAARLCGVQLARVSITDPLQGSPCTSSTEECPIPNNRLDKERLEMIETWRASACHTLWLDPND
jgi:hypothetical protein